MEDWQFLLGIGLQVVLLIAIIITGISNRGNWWD